ncbi:MAG: general secretion pathway protein E [Bradymonadia bacterium]|jgi:general secretion pathway protein E
MSDVIDAFLAQPKLLVVPAAVLIGVLLIVVLVRAYRASRSGGPRTVESRSLPPLKTTPGAKIDSIPGFQRRLNHRVSRQDGSPAEMLDDLFAMGFSLAASDIHFTPSSTGTRVAMRVHGVLYEMVTLPADFYLAIVSRVRVLSDITFYERNKPQDGEIRLAGGYTARVSMLPTNRGEKCVFRLAGTEGQDYDIDKLGMDAEMLGEWKALLTAAQGLLVLTGPTGSGKTTTMYAALTRIAATRGDSANIVTLEDPVEFDFDTFSQTQIDPVNDLTFATGLRSLLRQDPDVILVGEIRDDETTEIALRASMTGHLILTTLHADSASGVFNRLLQMNAQPFHVASALRAVISQRLCKRLCPDCLEPTSVTDENRRVLRQLRIDSLDGPFFRSRGCENCLDKGFIGRVPIFELLIVTERVRDLINESQPTHVIDRAAREDGMLTLFDDGLRRARRGEVLLDELLSIVIR